MDQEFDYQEEALEEVEDFASAAASEPTEEVGSDSAEAVGREFAEEPAETPAEKPAAVSTSFGTVTDRLSEIADVVEDSTLPLDDALDLLEEAVALGMQASNLLESDMDARNAAAEDAEAEYAVEAETVEAETAEAETAEADVVEAETVEGSTVEEVPAE